MMEVHVCRRDGRLLKAFAIGDAAEYLVGRDDGCDIQIRSPKVSREHCAIESQGDELILRDLDSTSGTYFNGQRIDRIRLRDGMEVVVGPALLKFFDAGL